MGEPVPPRPLTPDSDPEYAGTMNSRRPAQLSQVAANAFTDSSVFSISAEESSHRFNSSELGYVHLPPLPSSPAQAPSDRETSSGSSAITSWVQQQSQPGGYFQGRAERIDDGNAITRSSSVPPSSSLSSVAHGSSRMYDEERLITSRYHHVEDENGHHVVTGREGKLTRCEDEPIRTPGAIQGFGVLIAVDEDPDKGTLLVRQVSENATEILGLSPKYLFSLECFTDALPDTQADVLWDNIQFLSEPYVNADGQEDSPHVFLLSGWGEPGSGDASSNRSLGRREWTCWCALHRAPVVLSPEVDAGAKAGTGLIVLEFELELDTLHALYPISNDIVTGSFSPSDSTPGSDSTGASSETLVSADVGTSTVVGANNFTAVSQWPSEPVAQTNPEDEEWKPSAEDILESTTNYAKPIPALERLRRLSSSVPSRSNPPASTGPGRNRRGRRKAGATGVGMMDVFAVMAQINEQLGSTTDLDMCLKVVVGIIKDLTQFHRVMVYQFDEVWNGQVVAELVDWSKTHELYNGLHFPASDIPAQARQLYTINTVRMLYDRDQPTARIVVRHTDDLKAPLDMTHSYLRAMSPIHIKYLENMGVRASLSVSVIAFGQLWGLVSCHSHGSHGMRVSFPVRQMLRLLSQTISRNIERLSYSRRLQTRRLINPMTPDNSSSGYIVSNADDLLTLFDADYGILVIGEGAKIFGPNLHGQEILAVAEYLRLKQFDTIQVSQALVKDFPDLQLSTGLEVIAGLLYVPLSTGGNDFIAMLRKGQPRNVKWAGRPNKVPSKSLEPRKSFRTWSETVAGRSRAWTEEELETAGVLALLYGKFIEVWRQKESALQTSNLTNLLLTNASHEVRTPLNHIINYLELAMNSQLDGETRDHLSRSHTASKNLLFTINDLLDLTRLESGNEISFNEPFNLRNAIEDATRIYSNEAARRLIDFRVSASEGPKGVLGDVKKIKTVVANLTANALKYTSKGSVSVHCRTFEEPQGLRRSSQTAVEIVVADTGCGIPPDKLQSIFREFEQVESADPRDPVPGVGLGLAVVARIVEQLGGQLRVESTVGVGSRFSFLIPLELSNVGSDASGSSSAQTRSSSSLCLQSRTNSQSSGNEIDNIFEAFTGSSLSPNRRSLSDHGSDRMLPALPEPSARLQAVDDDVVTKHIASKKKTTHTSVHSLQTGSGFLPPLRVLVVEDNDINRKILSKRLEKDGHDVVGTTNGQEGLDTVKSDYGFDCILMDIQMPILNGFESTEQIRKHETTRPPPDQLPEEQRRQSQVLNGRIPIFAVSASLFENQRGELLSYGFDGWLLKPIDFDRLRVILKGTLDRNQRKLEIYKPGRVWEAGGWLCRPPSSKHRNTDQMTNQQPHIVKGN
ncbi:hypothetical protein CONPUDRAFT_104552 [Coniophora puteana RWD-64-598 SS2]|uniref:Phytochrome n=1 Tax=Coniophora puteana (strain RWD-64-598) TaxID=741705 RepID=A0A5M3MPY9_CONPW|nr:uncharacterized protein CONPUDRAFT_104552 [Coniophora puteana RWD-64-598 SS2]EIW81252.1 hypothetical protein CONPUDRAFT_104552 [Coniophora puteana RWD-64-598 SS2]